MTLDIENIENKGIGIDIDELIKNIPDDDYDIEKNDVDYSATEGWFCIQQ